MNADIRGKAMKRGLCVVAFAEMPFLLQKDRYVLEKRVAGDTSSVKVVRVAAVSFRQLHEIKSG